MFSVEKLCNKISSVIAKDLNYDKDKEAVVNYGMFALIQTTISVLAVIIFGAIFKVLVESLIITLSICILRKSAGGAHASSPGKCAVLGTIAGVGCGLIIKHIVMDIRVLVPIEIAVFIGAFILVYKLAPVDSAAKPIKNILMIRKLKRNSLIILIIYLLIVICNMAMFLTKGGSNFLIYSSCICIGIIIEVFSLTNIGHRVLNKIDQLI